MRDGVHILCVKVLDAALVISQPAVMTATVTPTMATCNGANDAIITISAPAGGYGTYQYSINGGTSWQGSGTFTNLIAPASYDVRIRDAANPGCVITLNAALALTQPAILTASIASTPVTCFGGGDGTITISAPAGGYGTYEYSINGGGSWQASGNFTALTPGAYNILIRDAAHITCVKVLNNSYAVTQPALLSATVGKIDVTCLGAADGIINITAPSGGYGTYEYSIDGGTSWQASGSYTALAPATYDVRIRDAAHTACTAILYPNLLITEPLVLSMSSTGNILLNCFNDATGSGTFFASGGTLPYTFSVTANTTGATIAAPGFNSQSFFGAGAGIITVGVLDLHGCFASATITVTQPALLTPGSVGTDQVLCSGLNPAQLTETVPATGGPGAYNYQWQYSASAAGTYINIAGATAFQYTPPAGATTTIYYRRMVTSGVCVPVYSNVVEVRVNPLPVAILTGGETICPAQTSILKVNMMVGTGPFELNILGHGIVTGYTSGTDIIVSPGATTTYTLVSAKDANGCMVTSPSANLIGSATVTVRALPAITTSPVNKTICEFGQTSFAVTATGTDLTYQWYVNEGSGFIALADGGVYFGATGATLSIFGGTRLMTGYIYHAVVTGCASSVTSGDATLTVNTVPEIVTQPSDSTICLGANATFSVTATGTAITYKWQMNNVDIVNGGSFSGATTNTLTITGAGATLNGKIFRVIVSGTCGVPVYSNMAVLRVNTPPVITLNPVNKVACDGTGPIVFTGNGTGLIDSLRWQVNSGSGWSDIYDGAVYSGTSSQQLTLANVPIAFNGNQYRLGLKAKCVTATTTGATLTVNANPIVTFAVNPINACGEVPMVLAPVITSGSGTWSTHNWTGDIGPLNNYFIQSPTFNSQIAGTYNLNYKVKDNKGCFGNADVQVLVDAPDATFNQDINNGCTPAAVAFTKDMTGYVKFWWDFGDGSPKDSVNANPVHTFTNASPSSIQYLNVKLTVKSAGGCLDTYTSNMTVYPAIDATFAITPAIICSGNTAVITAAKPGASKYFWDYGDGTSGYSPTESTTHVYTNLTTAPQVLTVTLTTTSFYNCTDVKTQTITVMPVPLPQFSIVGNPTQVFDPAGNPFTFTNETNAGTWTWLWRFGDGTTSSAQSPTHTYTALGDFNVVLTVSNANCSDSVKHQVRVTPEKSIASFDSIPSDCEPLTITINNTTTHTDIPGTTYRWDFGDGGTSTAKNPTYTYFDPGTYKIELTVTGPGGTTSYSQVVSSYPSPQAYFEVAPLFVYVNDEQVRGFNKSQFADSYLWEWGDGDTSKLKDPYHKYMTSGTFDISLWAYSHNVIDGKTIVCSDQFILSPGVTVEPAGEIRFATVFTPNLSGPIEGPPTTATMDQFFYPPIQESLDDYKLQIFNRLGVLIFESHSVNVPWNGYYKGKLCSQGVYVWYVEGKYKNGKPFKKVGDITLLH
jgi:PKD repeat protein